MKLIKVIAGVRKAEKNDLFDDDNQLMSNIVVFIRYKDGYEVYITQGDEYISSGLPEFNGGRLYVLTTDVDRIEYSFKMIIRQSEISDVFLNGFWIRTNLTYYYRKNEHLLEGPFKISPNQDEIVFEANVLEGKIYTITQKQFFEPVEFAFNNAS